MAEPAPVPLWTSEEIAAAVGGSLHGAPFAVTGVTFDTREVQPGDLFVALSGARDGHDFAGQAFAAGAAGALVSRPVEVGPAVLAGDTLRALEALGVAARDRSGALRAAVTGSVGKTSVTQAIAVALRMAGAAHASVKSFNNHIGVPLTLARMPRETQRAVFEIGMNHAGEIGPLSKMVRPHVAVITTVGPVHTENFPDGEAGVARAKAEIFEGLAPGGVAILNADDRWFEMLREAAAAKGARVLSFGATEGCDARLLPSPSRGEGPGMGVSALRLLEIPGGVSGELSSSSRQDTSTPDPSPLEGEGRFSALIHGEPVSFTVGQAGAHWGPNGLAVLLALHELEVPRGLGLEALAGFGALAGRGLERVIAAADGPATLIDESYNANPVSLRAALDTLSRRVGRRIAVLTDMLELGSDGPDIHVKLAPYAVASADLIFTAGPLMRALHEALPAQKRGGWAQTAVELSPQVVEAVRAGDVVMVKGSNGSKASLIAQALQRMGDPA